MKRRARRVVIGGAALVAVVVGVLVATHWGTIRDHVEAWHFQLTRDTQVLIPEPGRKGQPGLSVITTVLRPNMEPRYSVNPGEFLRLLKDFSGTPVIVQPHEYLSEMDLELALSYLDGSRITGEDALRELRAAGFRILEQRFPRSAHVVIRNADPPGWNSRY